jgi:hypothetical protein
MLVLDFDIGGWIKKNSKDNQTQGHHLG